MYKIGIPTQNQFKYKLLADALPSGYEATMIKPEHIQEDHQKTAAQIALDKLQMIDYQGLTLASDIQFAFAKSELDISNESQKTLAESALKLCGIIIEGVQAANTDKRVIIDPQIQKPFLNNSAEIRDYWRGRIKESGSFCNLLIGLAARSIHKNATSTVVLPFVLSQDPDAVWPKYDENEYRPETILDDLLPVTGEGLAELGFNLRTPAQNRQFLEPLTTAVAYLLTQVNYDQSR